MPNRDKVGEGRAAVESATRGVADALVQWRNASDAEKGAKAQNVLAHVGSLSGMKLIDFIDKETAMQIKADFESVNK